MLRDPDGGVISGGSMSTLSEESSSDPDGSGLELGLGLSLGGGGKSKSKTMSVAAAGGSRDQFARFLTAEDFHSVVSVKDSLSSSSSSSSIIKAKNNGCCGSKRTAEPSSPPGRSGVSQVVGWPPIRAYRMNSLVNLSKTPAVEEFTSTLDKCENENKNIAVEKRLPRTSFFIKVNMEGTQIGRKVDLNAHSCYETLARKLDDMFFRPGAPVGPIRSGLEEQAAMADTRCPVRLLDDSSEFVLIYEDKEGDWMLVGDVPWQMFLSTVRRLKIMKTSEANGLGMSNSEAPRAHERNRRQLMTHPFDNNPRISNRLKQYRYSMIK